MGDVKFTKSLENIRIERRLKARVDVKNLCRKINILLFGSQGGVTVYVPLTYYVGNRCNMKEI